MLVIPAIDLLDGKVVRLHQGRYDQATVYDDNPAVRASEWSGKVPRLHVVDLEGARSGHSVQTECIRSILSTFAGEVQVGGGVRSKAAFESYVALGVRRVVLGTAAVREPEFVRSLALEYPEQVIVAVDAKDGWVAIEGWTEISQVSAIDLARSFAALPIAGILYTDVLRDGTGVGPNVQMTARLAREAGVRVIASGGVGTVEHLRTLAAEPRIEAAIVGRALYDGSLTLKNAISAARGSADGEAP